MLKENTKLRIVSRNFSKQWFLAVRRERVKHKFYK
jgi:hypothetical protein